MAGRGILSAWNEPGFFERVRISPWRSIAWDDDVELCADALYLKLTGKMADDIGPGPAADRIRS